MIRALKEWLKRHWPRLRLRTILFATLFFVAALPGVGAIFLRVYENTLVRQTEAELIAQGAALAATARAAWPGAPPLTGPLDPQISVDRSASLLSEPEPAMRYTPEQLQIDLSSTPILSERPDPVADPRPPDPEAAAAAERLLPILGATRQTTLASIILLDRNGRVVRGPDAGKSYAALPEIRAALAGRSATELRRSGGYRQVYWFEWLSRAAAIRVHYARPILVDGKPVGVLLLSRSARGLFKGLYEDSTKIIIGVLAILAALVVLSGLVSRGIARPIERLSAATRELAAGRGKAPEVPQTAAIEIQGLYRDFAIMAEAIDHRSRYLRDFAHAVSHEFKTPLAGIRGAIELLEDHDDTMSEADRKRFLANAAADANRLAALVTRLLELARADMTRQEVGVSAELTPVLVRVADAMRSEGFAVTLDLPPALPAVSVPETTLEAIVTTLIENSRQAKASEVAVTATAADDAVTLTIRDNGNGILPADRDRIFEPFFTTRRGEGGTGLGLSIVQSLLEAADGAIRLAESEAGTCFVLELPLARST